MKYLARNVQPGTCSHVYELHIEVCQLLPLLGVCETFGSRLFVGIHVLVLILSGCPSLSRRLLQYSPPVVREDLTSL